ncbi:MAG: acetylglutamate kinase [Leptospiraceae bacterium]|nr:acetylglutamate kinase [Leptospiraceae bacterium]
MEENISKIKNILEALPYITEFANKIIVVKYGGAAMVKDDLKESFARDIVLLKYLGIHPIIVHGGGPEINQILDILKLPVKFVRGNRVTDKQTMEVVEMVLSGKLNKQIVSLINSKGGNSVGISGRDGKLAIAEIQKIEVTDESGKPELVDVGFVGKITRVNKTFLESLLSADIIPVISPVAEDNTGQALNINADTMAGAIAGTLGAEKLILLTDTPGILIKGNLADSLSELQVNEYISSGDISGGMIPKVECCLDAIQNGVKKTHIIDGRVPHSLLIELFTTTGIGTLIG